MKIPKGSWEYSGLFSEISVAKEWGYQDPLEYWKLPKISRILMTAYLEVSGEMQSYETNLKSKDI